jgi:alpha-D-xyloside xylohydrolase
MARPPIVDDLYTRCLETRDLERSSVKKCEMLQQEGGALVLRTRSDRYQNRAGQPDSEDWMALLPREGPEGILRIDVVSDGVVRVRYAEGDAVPEGDTPMVVSAPPPPSRVDVENGEECVVLATPAARFEIGLDPFTLRARDAAGRVVAEVGGPEKNHFQNWDVYNTGIGRARDGRPLAFECFALRPQEAVFGFGEKFLALDKVGQTVDLNMVEALGTTTPRSYKNVPFFWSTRGWGVFFNHSARMTCWVGSRGAADVQVAIEDDFIDYYLFIGSPKEILARYTDLTGKPQMPPRWSFGFWQSKISYQSADEALDVVRRNRAAEIPTDVLHLDTHWFREDWYCDLEFARDRFPDPAGFLKEMADLGVKVSLWQLPYIPEGSNLFNDLLAVEGFVKTEDGDLYDVGICYTPGFEGRVGCIDFTNPEAKRVYQSYLRRLFEQGARVIKVDFGEQAPLDGVYHDGTPGHRMHNLYPLLYNQAVAEATFETTGESIIWARSAWAGSQRYPLHWGGDSSANWHNLAPQIQGGLSLGLCGFPFWSMDIGGFVGETGGPLLVRWMQAGVFFSHPRIHGMGNRELDQCDPETLRLCRDALQLHYRLLPYLWSAARECALHSLPVSRALVLEYPEDPTTWSIGDQWLLGDALLVAPILDESGSRRVYLPAGIWTDWWTGVRTAGPCWIEVKADLATIPLWMREGAVIPMAPVMGHVDERPLDELTLRVAPFVGDGVRELAVPTSAGDLRISYRAAAGRHVVTTSPGARFDLEGVGEEAPVVEHRSA